MKRKYSRYVAEAIPVVAFNIVYFLLAENFTAARWLGWGCLHAAYVAFMLALRGIGAEDRKAVFGYPKAGVAFGLFLATLAAFAAIFIVNPSSEKWPVVIEVFATAGLGVVYFALDVAEAATRELEGELRRNYAFIATTAQVIEEARRAVSDVEIRKAVEHAYDAVRNGNVMSVQEAATVEAEVSDMAGRLLEIAGDGGHADEIRNLAKKIATAMERRETLIRNARRAR